MAPKTSGAARSRAYEDDASAEDVALAFDGDVHAEDAAFAEADVTRSKALRALQAQLQQAASVGSREAFCLAFARAQKLLEMDDVEIAGVFQISRPTVGRWARGEAAPHPVGRTPILEALGRRVAKKLKLITDRE